LRVETRIQAVPERLEQRRDAAARLHPEPLHDARRLDDREPLPRGAVRVHGSLHPVRALHRLKPEAVVREPVLRVIHRDPDELLTE